MKTKPALVISMFNAALGRLYNVLGPLVVSLALLEKNIDTVLNAGNSMDKATI